MRVLLLLLLLWQPGQALAHAALLEADPQDGASYDAAPAEARLRFDEPVGLIALGLAGPDGPLPLARPARVDGDVLSAGLPAGLGRGTYLLSWRVTSADSHPVGGTIAFGVGVVPDAAAAPPEPSAAPSMALRAVFLAVLLGVAGGAMFRLVAALPGPRLLAVLGWAGVALAVLQVGVRGALLGEAPLLSAAAWRLGAGTTLAASLAVTAAGLAGCALTLPSRRGGLGVAAALLALVGLPLSGHAGTAEPRWLTAPALVLHAAAGAFWLGALVPLLLLLRRGDALAAVRRFSAAAVPAVAVLLLSGLALATVQLGSLAMLTGSPYGRVLLLKLAAVAGLLALAGLNRLVFTPRGATRALRFSIAGELACAAAVLAATGVLGLTPPARATTPPERSAWTVADGIPATLAVSPGHAGRNRVTLTIGRPAQPREVTLELRNAAAGVAAVRRPMRRVGGDWVWEGNEIALPGRWDLRAEALLTEFDQTTFTTEIDIP